MNVTLNANQRQYQICTQCIMDTTVPDIVFDEQGICNYCKLYKQRMKTELYRGEEAKQQLQTLVQQIKRKGIGHQYDCLIGVSGGVDSTYVAYLVKKVLGLRPLAVHLDNGWDAELAVSNIEKTLKRLDIDLITHVLDWEEFKDLQNAFLKSSIANAEIPTDQAITAVLFQTAAAQEIQYIITGHNVATEGIMPKSWMYNSIDQRFITAIHKQFGTTNLRTYPRISLPSFLYYMLVRGVKFIPILNMVEYVKDDVKRLLQNELDWRDYGGKHYESIYTRFFQSYLLPQKFSMDKRRPHLSSLILSGQMSRESALAQIAQPPCDPEQIETDIEYVIKKLGLSYEQFSEILTAPVKTIADFPNNSYLWTKLLPLGKIAIRRAMNG